MTNLRCLIQTVATIACAALVLGLLGGDAMAAKRPPPPTFVMWPTGASADLVYHPFYPGSLGEYVSAQWPIANGADHYRLTVVYKSGGVSSVQTWTLEASRTGCIVGGAKGSYLVTVTAYSGPDEAVAYSESLQGRISVR
jgi:hypothetical protein